MAIEFTIARRGLLRGEEGELKDLYPRLRSRQTVDAVKFQEKAPWGTVLSWDTLAYALGELQHIMLHEMREGKAVYLPGIGTFRLGLKGDIEVRGENYHGKDVHVDEIQYKPDRELLRAVRRMPVIQVPFGQAFEVNEDKVEVALTRLFQRDDTITHKSVFFALNGELTTHRVTSLLQRLVREGRLRREGERAQTRYRATPGNFGR